jgi:pSer/pThr/pTyr-binding forkhead associated (FHA) protein
VSTDPPQTSAAELKAQIEAERGGRPFLVLRNGAGAQRIVVIEEGTVELWVGRGEATGLRIDWDEEVSALHAQVEVVGGECTLLDDGLSRNGSFVGEERVHGRRRLRDGDTLRFGRTRVLFRRPGESAPEATVVATETPAAAAVSPGQRRVLISLCRPFKDGSAFATPPTNQAIAAELHLSVDAVKTHMRALFERLGVADLPQNQKRVALVERALQSGIVAPRDL